MTGQADKKGARQRKNLAPTGPAKMPADRRRKSYEEKHPNPGNAGQDTPAPQTPIAADGE